MRWRQVAGLYVVVAVLGGLYWWEGRSPAPPEPEGSPRRPRFLALGPLDVRALRIERAGRTIRSRRDGSGWTVVEPSGASIPSDLVAAFTAALVGADEIQQVAEGGDGHAFGLAEGTRVELEVVEGAPVVVVLGATNAAGTALYARRSDRPEIVLIGRNVGYYQDLLFQALPAGQAPPGDEERPVGG